MSMVAAARTGVAVLLWIGVSGIGQTADAQTSDPAYAGSRDAVMDLLSLVPNMPAVRHGTPLVSYADLDAIVRTAHAAAGTPDAAMATLGNDEILWGLRRAIGPGRYLEQLAATSDALPDVLGVGLADIRRGLEFGTPPNWGLILGLDPLEDHGPAIGSALDARDFSRSDIGGVTVWHRFPHGEMNIDARNPADPFGGALGQPARIAYLNGALVGSPAWPIAGGMVAVADGGPSLANNIIIRSAVEAVTDPAFDGVLLQLMLFNATDLMVGVPDFSALMNPGTSPDIDSLMPQAPAGSLPPYLMVAMADRFTGDGDEAVIALVYPDDATAEAAAAVLADRLRDFAPASNPEAWTERLTDLDATIAPHLAAAGADTLAAAVVSISYRAPAPGDGTTDGLRSRGGALFTFLLNAVWRRELTPLIATE